MERQIPHSPTITPLLLKSTIPHGFRCLVCSVFLRSVSPSSAPRCFYMYSDPLAAHDICSRTASSAKVFGFPSRRMVWCRIPKSLSKHMLRFSHSVSAPSTFCPRSGRQMTGASSNCSPNALPNIFERHRGGCPFSFSPLLPSRKFPSSFFFLSHWAHPASLFPPPPHVL